MPRNTSIDRLDGVPRPVVAIGNAYPDAHRITHSHRRSQLLYGVSGTVVVATVQGSWVVPPQHGLWIPGGIEHDVQTLGAVSTQSLYFEPDARLGMPDRCEVLGIPPIMRGLIAEAVDLPADYDPASRAGALMTLIEHEMRRLPVLPLSLPFPAHPVLAERCRLFLRRPTAHDTIDRWCDALGMSRRAFTRIFRRETGLSFVAWRQQACLFAALPRLASGETVTAVAIDLGYDNPAAFTTMFRRVLGAPPRDYLKQHR